MAEDAGIPQASNSSMTIPGSLTDIAKAIRELLGLVQDAGQLIGSGVQVYDRRRSRKAAEKLYGLAFTPEGMRGSLQRIAAGDGTDEDFLRIERLLSDTSSQVERDIRKLLAFEDRLREALGWKAAELLHKIISGPFGKEMTRMRLAQIVAMGRSAPPPLEDMRRLAKQVDSDIEKLNRDLRRLHDLILNAAQPPTAKT